MFFTKGYGMIAIVEHNSVGKTLFASGGQRSKTCKISPSDCCRCFNFDACNHAIIPFEYDVHFVHSLVSKVVRRKFQLCFLRLVSKTSEYTKLSRIGSNSLRFVSDAVKFESTQSRKQTGVKKMQFWCLDNPFQCVRIPRSQHGD